MDYQELERLISAPRAKKYLEVASGDGEKAVKLYFEHSCYSSLLFSTFSFFEVLLRNKIDDFMCASMGRNWLIDLSRDGSVLDTRQTSITFKEIKRARLDLGNLLSNDQMVNSVSLGFWTSIFQPIQYRQIGNNYLSIFVTAPVLPNLLQSVHSRINRIRRRRNRIAHNQPILFIRQDSADPTSSFILSFVEVEEDIAKIRDLLGWLGENPSIINGLVNRVNRQKTVLQALITT